MKNPPKNSPIPIIQKNSDDDDDMLPEYDLSQLSQLDRGKYAQAMLQGYSVTVHHPDGTSTTRHIPPQNAIGA